VARALAFIKNEQDEDGSWFGRWGVNHIYGTAAVLPALAVIGEDMSSKYLRLAGDWIAEHQNGDGGWGETPASYVDDALRGVGDSTASQTAWALMALLPIPTARYDQIIQKGIEYLLSMQHEGTWHEPQYTGTGFPGYGAGSRLRGSGHEPSMHQGLEVGRGFMINYNLYRHYFPLMALSRARSRILCRGSADSTDPAVPAPLRCLESGFLNDLGIPNRRRRRYRGRIAARRLIRKTAQLLLAVPPRTT
jgi:squalene-hopene/tetraprenyl-beta-curcumene cyclase